MAHAPRLLAAAVLLYASAAPAATVELDATYGAGGVVVDSQRLDAASFGDDLLLPAASLVLADGSVAFAGRAAGRLEVRRFGPLGTPDTGFGNGVAVGLPIDGGSPGLAAAADGRLVVAGTLAGAGGVRVVRLLPDGTLDRTFGSDGVADRALPGLMPLSVRIAIDAAGRIVVAAGGSNDSTATPLHVWRLRADGSPDPAFIGAAVRDAEVSSYGMFPIGLAAMADGSTFVLVERPVDNNPSRPAAPQLLLRFDDAGRFDRAIGTPLLRLTAIHSDDRLLYLLGQSGPASGGIAVLRPDGTPFTESCGSVWDFPAVVDAGGWVLPLLVRRNSYLLTLVGRYVDADGAARGLLLFDFEEDCSPFTASYSVLDVPPVSGLALGSIAGGAVLAGTTFGPGLDEARPAVARLRYVRVGEWTSPGRLAFAHRVLEVTSDRRWVDVSVRRTGGAAGPASVDYETEDASARAGQDYAAARGRLDWAAGDAATRTVRVPLSARPAAGSTLRFAVKLARPTGAVLAQDPVLDVYVSAPTATVPPPAGAPAPTPAPAPPDAAASGGGGATSPLGLAWLLAAALLAARGRQRRAAS